MAKSRKQQRAAANLAQVAKATQVAVEVEVTPSVYETAAQDARNTEPEPKIEKPAKKRYVRAARQESATAVSPLARGTSHAAKSMSAKIAKGIVGGSTGSTSGTARLLRSQGAGSLGSEGLSSRASRRLAKRQASES